MIYMKDYENYTGKKIQSINVFKRKNNEMTSIDQREEISEIHIHHTVDVEVFDSEMEKILLQNRIELNRLKNIPMVFRDLNNDWIKGVNCLSNEP